MLARKTFYDKGFHDCYIGRTLDSNEMCSIVWQVTFRDVERTRSENLFPELRQDEAFQENIYTLEKYRGKGIMGSTGRQLDETARKQGFKRMFNYTREDNIPPLRASKGRGLFIYARVLCCYFLFKKKNRIIERFDPPIPISVPHKVHS
jgi:GNAT superfamily N-acetyltransferase